MIIFIVLDRRERERELTRFQVVNKVFGGLHGYGILPTTLDWTVISGYTGSPLIPPFYAIANILAGIVFFFVIVSCGIHFSGMWYADYFPVQSSHSFDNTGGVFNVSRILNDQMQFDEAKYFEYSPLFLSTQFALAYGLAFAAVSSIVVHVVLYHGHDIMRQFKQARGQEDVCKIPTPTLPHSVLLLRASSFRETEEILP